MTNLSRKGLARPMTATAMIATKVRDTRRRYGLKNCRMRRTVLDVTWRRSDLGSGSVRINRPPPPPPPPCIEPLRFSYVNLLGGRWRVVRPNRLCSGVYALDRPSRGATDTIEPCQSSPGLCQTHIQHHVPKVCRIDVLLLPDLRGSQPVGKRFEKASA